MDASLAYAALVATDGQRPSLLSHTTLDLPLANLGSGKSASGNILISHRIAENHHDSGMPRRIISVPKLSRFAE